MRRKPIFEDEMDYQVFLQILKISLIKYNCMLHAYCLMTNHIHLLVETGDMENVVHGFYYLLFISIHMAL